MRNNNQNTSNLTDITGMFDAETIRNIAAGYPAGIEDILDGMIREAFVHAGHEREGDEPKWTFNERVCMADLIRVLKLVARLLCKVIVKSDTVMLNEEDALRLHRELTEICGGRGRAENLRHLEDFMITKLSAPFMIGEFLTMNHVNDIIFYYRFLKGIVSSYNPDHMESRAAA
jgi:hypothetical protein